MATVKHKILFLSGKGGVGKSTQLSFALAAMDFQMNSGRCAACKHLRRRCPSDCIFSPYFPSNNRRRFAYVHRIYGASNVGKMLQDLPVNRRADAADSLYYEAYCRIKDPVYGCVGIITILHQKIYEAQCELARTQVEMTSLGTTQTQPVETAPTFSPTFSTDHQNTGNSSYFHYNFS